MPLRIVIAITMVILCLSLAALSARADWEYTQWGMTRDAVIAASKAAAEKDGDANPARIAAAPTKENLGKWADAKGDKPDLVAFHQQDAFLFTAMFFFDAQGLKSVALLLNNADLGSTLHIRLSEKYGRPVGESDPIMTHEEWRLEKDWITFGMIGAGTSAEDLVTLNYWRPGSLPK